MFPKQIGGLPPITTIGLFDELCGRERSEAILEALRQTARDIRDTDSQPFYSIRSAARHFGIPAAAVARMYVRLRHEGLLSTVWGAKTRVEPAELDRQLHVRAYVAVPVCSTRLAVLDEYAAFVAALVEQLKAAGFAAHPLVYQNMHSTQPDFAAMVIRALPDAVIWPFPPTAARENLARFGDRGIKVICVAADGESANRNLCRVSRRRALTRCINAWRTQKIEHLTVVRGDAVGCDPAVADIQSVLAAAEEKFETVQVISVSELQSPQPVRNGAAVIFSSSLAAARLTAQSPVVAQTLFQSRQTLLYDGAFHLPFTDSDAPGDVLSFDATALARRVVVGVLGRDDEAQANATVEARWVRQIQRRDNSAYLPRAM